VTAYPTHEAASRAHRQRPTAYLYRRDNCRSGLAAAMEESA